MKGRNLNLKSLLTSYKPTSDGINLVLFNLNIPLKPFFVSFVNILNDLDYKSVDAFFNFDLPNTDPSIFRKITWGQNIESAIAKNEKPILALAELSSISLHLPCFSLLQSLKKLKKTVILFANEDVCSTEILSQLKYSCKTVLIFESSTFGDLNNMKLEVKKSSHSGKSTTEWYEVSVDNLRLKLRAYQKKPLCETNETSTVEDTMGSLSTFKLSLTESEQRSRANVKLPYFKHQKVQVEESSKTSSGTATSGNADGAQIMYEADIDDDFDYEDPDDDLDI